MVKRSMLAGLLVAGLVLGRSAPSLADARMQANEAGVALGTAALNLFYTPVKVAMAAIGLPLGSLVGVLTGGDTRSAYALWVPAASGDYALEPATLDEGAPPKFFGDDYRDQPSPLRTGAEATAIYDAAYFSR
jgi:hypothetical protein